MDTTVALSAAGLLYTIFISPMVFGDKEQSLEGKKICDFGPAYVVSKDDATLLVKHQNQVLLFKKATSEDEEMQRFVSPSGKYAYIHTSNKSMMLNIPEQKYIINDCKDVE
jgi:hypothetical protein